MRARSADPSLDRSFPAARRRGRRSFPLGHAKEPIRRCRVRGSRCLGRARGPRSSRRRPIPRRRPQCGSGGWVGDIRKTRAGRGRRRSGRTGVPPSARARAGRRCARSSARPVPPRRRESLLDESRSGPAARTPNEPPAPAWRPPRISPTFHGISAVHFSGPPRCPLRAPIRPGGAAPRLRIFPAAFFGSSALKRTLRGTSCRPRLARQCSRISSSVTAEPSFTNDVGDRDSPRGAGADRRRPPPRATAGWR